MAIFFSLKTVTIGGVSMCFSVKNDSIYSSSSHSRHFLCLCLPMSQKQKANKQKNLIFVHSTGHSCSKLWCPTIVVIQPRRLCEQLISFAYLNYPASHQRRLLAVHFVSATLTVAGLRDWPTFFLPTTKISM